MEFSFGSDPEFILRDGEGEARSAIGVVPGTKSRRVEVGGDFFFYDNVLAECTVKPAHSRDETVANFGGALASYAEMVRPLRLTTDPCEVFSRSEMSHKDARKAGCDREYCAYSMGEVPAGTIRRRMKESGFRTAGGHVHIGTPLGRSHEDCVMLVRMLDLVLGLSSIMMDSSRRSSERRKMYGAAGRYRQPKHGVEYRTMGNFWLASPSLVGLIFDISRECVAMCERGVHNDFWRVDHGRLESDEFWNSGGDPSDCHECTAYDPALLRSLFAMEREEAMKRGAGLFDMAFSLMPDWLTREIKSMSGQTFDLYGEWGLE
jgi:hypothetical protein